MNSRSGFKFPHEFEPLLPEGRRAGLLERARETVSRSLVLSGSAHPSTIRLVRELLTEMNSYYSNRIEGQSTHPLDIARALKADYSHNESTAMLQRLAVAHIDAEHNLSGATTVEALHFSFLQRAHRELYEQLAPAVKRNGPENVIIPGAFRQSNVSVGRHVAPEPEAIELFAVRFDQAYTQPISLDESLIAIAAAHHRASWIHPFPDGNGRAIRLQTHAALFPLTAGLWSVSRGLARKREDYYRHLDAADAPRAGDLDGRGNLSDNGLSKWCEWFLDLCLDQVSFMATLLELDGIRGRIGALIAARAALDRRYRTEMVLPLVHLFASGPTVRGDVLTMMGLGERTARTALSHLLDVGLVTAPTRRLIQIAFPLDALQILFPNLYPEAATARVE